jgi:hypothetical protein
MANIFDFFIDRDEEQRRKKDAALGMPTLPAVLGRPPLVNKPRDINALMNQPAPPAPAPALAPPFSAGMGQGQPQAPPFGSGQVDPDLFLSRQPQYDTGSASVAPPVLTPREMLNAERVAKQSEIDLLLDEKKNPVLNKDHGFMGRLGDVLKQALVAGADSYRNAPGTGWEKLAGGVGGMAAGGFQGGFDPAVDERRARAFDVAKAQDQLALLDGRYKQSIGEEAAMAEIGNKQNENILNKPVEVAGPESGQKLMVKPADAFLAERQRVHDGTVAKTAKDRLTFDREKELANDIAAAQKIRDDREWERVKINMKSKEDVDTFNATAKNKARSEYLNASVEYAKAEQARTMAFVKQLGEMQGANTQMQGASDALNVAATRMAEAQEKIATLDPTSDAYETEQKNLEKAHKSFEEAHANVFKHAGNTTAAATILQGLPAGLPKPVRQEPTLRKYSEISVPKQSGRYAGQSFPSPDALQSAFPGKTVAQIKAIVEGQGGSFQR